MQEVSRNVGVGCAWPLGGDMGGLEPPTSKIFALSGATVGRVDGGDLAPSYRDQGSADEAQFDRSLYVSSTPVAPLDARLHLL